MIHWQTARTQSQKILDFLMPPRCTICNKKVNSTGALCGTCWTNLHHINDPQCNSCGLPFAFDIDKNALCGHCIKNPPPYVWARSALRYDDHSQGLILSLKHSKKLENAAVMARMMQQAGQGFFKDIDLIVPVPLHRKRLFKRRFNQSAYLAHYIAKQTNIALNTNDLERIKPTPPQVGLTYKAREKNVRGAFKVKVKESFKNKNIVLIDDVFTTGATVKACSQCLLKAGASSVGVLTFARTLKSN